MFMSMVSRRIQLGLLVASILIIQKIAGYGSPQTIKPVPAAGKNTSALQGALGETPKGWVVPSGYSARLVAEGSKPGHHSVLLEKKAQVTNAAPFGNIMRAFSAVPYRGTKLRFRATVRYMGDQPEGRAQMWMRVDRAKDNMGFFDNMENRPITDNAWRSYEITGPIADDAEGINLGLILKGSGKAWMDAVTIEAFDGKKWAPVPEDRLSAHFVPTAKTLDPKTEKAIVAELRERALPLATVEAGHGFDDLAPLDKIVGNARKLRPYGSWHARILPNEASAAGIPGRKERLYCLRHRSQLARE